MNGRIVGLLFLLAVVNETIAQDNTQYFVNLPSINAAFTGTEDLADAQVGFRQGWNAFTFKNNAYYFNFNHAAFNSYQALQRNNSPRISNIEASEKLQGDRRERRKHGIGGQVHGRQFGPYEKVMISFNYAYHLPLTDRLDFSLGAKTKLGHERLDFFDFTVRDFSNDSFFQQLMTANQGSQNSLFLDFGSVLYSRSFYAGFSTTNLLARKIGGSTFIETLADLRVHLVAGWQKPIGPDMTFNTSMMISGGDYVGVKVNGSIRFLYREKFLFGLGVEDAARLSGLLGFTLNNRLSLNYAYDHYLSGLEDFNVNVHEVVLKGVLFDKYRVGTKFW